jgi:iron complex outermembrane receptor protein
VPWRDHVARAALVASVASLAALALGRAGAQSIGQAGAEPPQDMAPLSVVTVTAQRRPQSSLDVNASVSAIDAATIRENDIRGVKDFFALVPNVNAQENGNGGPRSVTISMRGINDQGAGGERVAAVSAFAFYLDELSVGNAATDTANPPLYDIESIEVLRGPQGTYFGRNASGGAINIQTRKPGRKQYWQIDLGVGTQGSITSNGVLNVPLSDTVALRQTVQKQRDHGAVRNTYPGGEDSGTGLASGRTALRWRPSQDLLLDLSYMQSHETGRIRPVVASGQNRSFGFSRFPLDASFIGRTGLYPDNVSEAYLDAKPRTVNDSSVANLRMEARFEHFILNSVTGQSKGRSGSYQDLDGSGRTLIDRASTFRARSRSQELRLRSPGEQTVEWLAGAYVYDDANDFDNAILIKGVVFSWVPGDIANENKIHIRRSGRALFGDLSWHATPRLTVNAGARQSRDRDHQYWTDVYAANSAVSLRADDHGVPQAGAVYYPSGDDMVRSGGKSAQTIGTEGRNRGKDLSPRLAVNYKLAPDVRLYGSVARGYKAAGVRVNPDAGLDFPNISQYRKERVTSVEAGLKGVFFGNTRVEAALFNMVWRDFQVHINQSWCRLADGTTVHDTGAVACVSGPIPVDRIVNAERARSRGAELAWRTHMGGGLSAGGTLGLLDAKFIEYRNSPNGDVSGADINGAPRRTATLFGQWDGKVGAGSFYVRPELNYRGGFRNVVAPAAHAYSFGEYIAPRTLLNLRAGYTRGRATWYLSAENLFAKKYFTAYQDSVAGRKVDVHPRTIRFFLSVNSD